MLLSSDVFTRLCRARDLLDEVHDETLPVEHVARRVGISRFHFIRQFEAVFGLTPHQYRIRSRLDRARHLLATGRHSVTEVCVEVGFSSLGSFSSLFARRVGAAPSVYRRRLRPMVRVPGVVPRDLVPGCLGLMARLPSSARPQFSRSVARPGVADSSGFLTSTAPGGTTCASSSPL